MKSSTKKFEPYCLIESGHYYQCLWPTNYSLQSQEKAKEIATLMWWSPKHMKFIDDVHHESSYELSANKLYWNDINRFENFAYDYSILESDTIPYAFKIIDALKKSHATQHELQFDWKKLSFKGITLLHQWMPTCVLMDAWLTLMKNKEFWYLMMKNVLHENYIQQQESLKILIRAIKKTWLLHEKLSLQSVFIS
jgi:hypothetical protein